MTDLLLLGGGLANSLIALAFRAHHPDLDIRLLERDSVLGGVHTWSFHEGDLDHASFELVRPLIERSWASQEVRFPKRSRRLPQGYHSIRSPRLHEVVTRALGDRILYGACVQHARPGEIHLEDGRRLKARCVVDGRGWPASLPIPCGFQKFVGNDVILSQPHGLEGPILMDATVPQPRAYRFVYVLPWDERRLLIEETDYSDTPDLDEPGARERIRGYAAARGWEIESVQSEETGALPIPLAGAFEDIWPADALRIPRAGVRAGLFHPTTGYSLPDAARVALLLVRNRDWSSETMYAHLREDARRVWTGRAYFRFLNKMLFRAAHPDQRVRVFERFYGLSEGLIERFYAARLGWGDRIRLLAGKPPVPVHRALRCLWSADYGTAKGETS